MSKPINDDLLKLSSTSSTQDENDHILSFDETHSVRSDDPFTLTGNNPSINEEASFDSSVLNFATTDEEMAYQARVIQKQTVQREVSDSVSQMAQKIKSAEKSSEGKGLLSVIAKASASGLAAETGAYLKDQITSESNTENSLVSKYGRQACGSVLEPITDGKLEKALDSLGNLESLSTDLKNVVQNILTSAHSAETLSTEDRGCITDKIETGFTNQFVQRINKVQTGVKSLFANDSKSFNLFETKIGKDRTLSVNFQKEMSLKGCSALTGLKLSADGTDFAQAMTDAGELKDVLSVTLKNGTQADAAAVSLGYASGGSIYTPADDGVLYVTTSRPIGKMTSLNVFAQGNGDSNAVMTTLKFLPKDKPYQQTISVGSTDEETAVDASFEYTDKDKEKSVKAYAGVVDETATAKVSFEQQVSGTDKVSVNSTYVNTFMLNAEYLSKQSDALHKLGVSLTGDQAMANYTYQNGKGFYAQLGVEYKDENEKKVDVSFKTGCVREW